MRSDRIILICLAVSAAIHLLFFSDLANNETIKQATPGKSSIQITLTQSTPEPVTQTSPQAEQKPQVSKAPETRNEDTPENSELTEETTDNILDDKPSPEDDVKAEKPEEENNTRNAHSSPDSVDTQDAVSIISAASETEKLKYLNDIVKHINSNKHYPRRALNRGIQGIINISFDLHTDGSIENLNISNGHKLLIRASEQSINRALPMPERPDELLSLEVIHITTSMKYSIEN